MFNKFRFRQILLRIFGERASAGASQLFVQALALHQSGQFDLARMQYEKTLEMQPEHAEALHFLGVIAYQAGRFEHAISLIGRSIAVEQSNASSHANLGLALLALRRWDAAEKSCGRAIDLGAGANAQLSRGHALRELERLDAAYQCYRQATELDPSFADAHYHCAVALLALKRPTAALRYLEKAIAANPDYAEAHFSQGVTLQALDLNDAALESYERSLSLRPDFAEAHINRGNLLRNLGRRDEALACYDIAVKLNPSLAEGHNNRGTVLRDLGHLNDALASFERAIEIKLDYADAHCYHGLVLQDLYRYADSVGSLDRAIAIDPGYATAHHNRGVALAYLRKTEEALTCYDRAIALQPVFAEAFNNRGAALQELWRTEEALHNHDQSLAINPNLAEAWANRANALRTLGRYDLAIQSYDRALALKPHFAGLASFRLISKLQICEWKGIEAEIISFEDGITNNLVQSNPFATLLTLDSPLLHRRVSEVRARQWNYQATPSAEKPHLSQKNRMHIGYYSADFHEHATAYLMAGLFECHDRAKFEITAFSFGPQGSGEMRKRLSAAFDNFVDVRDRSDEDVAALSREMKIDIAIDLKGYTLESRPGIFAARAAEIQASYLGYPGTLALPCIDYLIADQIVIPESSRAYYTEKIVYLPDCYQINDSQRPIADNQPTRAKAGLPDNGFVFCCFNNSFKLTPDVFAVWMSLLKRIENSVLWLMADNSLVIKNLRARAEDLGIDAARLTFADRVPLAHHLARHRLADLFLDTLPYNAHTTASDALWAGLPVLTQAGTAFPGRVAASLLNAVGLPELVTQTREEYEAMAIELASHPRRLADIRSKLLVNRNKFPLFNTRQFARNIESAYAAMYKRHHAHLPPEHLFIDQQTA